MDLREWKKFKRSGSYRRKVKIRYESMLPPNTITTTNSSPATKNIVAKKEDAEDSEGSVQLLKSFDSDTLEECDSLVDSDSYMNKEEFRRKIANWALEYNITHNALNSLFEIVNKFVPCSLPSDARSLLQTNSSKINLIKIGNGQYWHNGLIEQLTQYLQNLSDIPDILSLNVNIDGLPIYKSSNHQFWPILCNVTEIKEIPPMVIGVYEGTSKPLDLYTYLQTFILEVKQLEHGLTIVGITGVEKLITCKIRAFICDAPARALIKGVMNFNGKHGCNKCTVVGEYSHVSHTVTFQSINCHKRNNEDFRERKYGQHHKSDSPLLELVNIDMVEDFPACDSLHLIDLGVMKRLLIGWRDGNFGRYITKWSSRHIEEVNIFLKNCHLPKEIHRAVRQLNVLAYWKASEYRSFLYYLSPVLLKNFLNSDAYHHYLSFFCAITICSNEKHFKLLRLAEELLKFFITHFDDFYGKDYITSNVHNLSHIVDEVRRFGILQNFNAYPFENKLFMIKRLLRQGNKPLEQVAKRLLERKCIELEKVTKNKPRYPFAKEARSKNEINKILYLETFVLSTQKYDKWFLTKENQVVEITTISSASDNHILLKGNCIENLSDAFEEPIKSSLLNIYKCDFNSYKKAVGVELTVANINCKLVCIKYKAELFFIPLLHTL